MELRVHHVRGAKALMESIDTTVDDWMLNSLKGDVAVQESRYSDATQWYDKALTRGTRWDIVAKKADVAFQTGKWEEAAQAYQMAADEITAREMRGYAWVELRHGLLELNAGRPAEALRHYKKAEQGYSGYWLTIEYMAEALAASGDYAEAIEYYQRLLANYPKPEFFQALGDLYVYMGKPLLAKAPYQRALQGYLGSADRGEQIYYHHLAGYYSDCGPNAREAVVWAKRDCELRACANTYEALAWALHLNGQPAEAASEMDKALASGARSPHLLCRAAIVLQAAGRVAEGRKCHEEMLQMNPRYETTFHVHR
jgi:tetratricopeptide (TPR) repeat protein